MADDTPVDAAVVRERVAALLAERKRAQAPGPRSMADVAERLGVSRGMLTDYLSGRRPLQVTGDQAVTVAAIAKALSSDGWAPVIVDCDDLL